MSNTMHLLEVELFDPGTKRVITRKLGGFSNQAKGLRAANSHAIWELSKLGIPVSEADDHYMANDSVATLVVFKEKYNEKKNTQPFRTYTITKIRVR